MQESPEREIRARIGKNGRITFAEFMALALFHPTGGYYASHDRVGPQGDYFTSPSAHPAFGAFLAIQLEQMWEALARPKRFLAVEVGAARGLLARDILMYMNSLSREFRDAICYLTLERWRVEKAEASPGVETHPLLTDTIPLNGVTGCLLSNELLDSFPVHRFQIKDGHLQEVYVTIQEDAFIEVLGAPSTPLVEERLESLGIHLPDGFRGEINLEIASWLDNVVQALERGFIITIDYGYEAKEMYSSRRSGGTLQCYYRHTQGSSPYVRIGRQDITAHVDFTSVMCEGEKRSLRALGFVTQREFLQNLGIGAFLKALRLKGLSQREQLANQMGMLELIKPQGLGDFKVLIQAKGLEEQRPSDIALYGLTPGNAKAQELEARASEMEVPMLRPEHTPVMEGKYPHTAGEWQELWPWGEGRPPGG